MATETKEMVIHVKFPDILIDIYIFKENINRKLIAALLNNLVNSCYSYKRIMGDLYHSVWFNGCKNEYWEMRFEKVDDEHKRFYRISLKNEDRKIIVDTIDVDLGKKFSLFLANNLENLDSIFKLLNEMQLHVMLG